MRGDLALDLGDTGKRPVPARLKFAGDQPVRRIGGVVLPEGAVGGIARRFKIAAKRLADLIPLVRGLGGRGRRRGDGARSDHAEQRLFDGVVDPQTAEGDATGVAIVDPGAATAVARDVVPSCPCSAASASGRSAGSGSARQAARRHAWARRDAGWLERCR